MKLKLKTWVFGVVNFMLLFPFRLPISVALIHFFTWSASLAGDKIPDNIMAANVAISKLVYDIIFGAWFIYSVEKLFRQIFGRMASEGMHISSDPKVRVYVYTVIIGILMCAYVIYDCAATTELFWYMIGKPLNPENTIF